MKIIVEGSTLYDRVTGVQRYTRCLLEAALRVDPATHLVAYHFAARHERPVPLSPPSRVRFERLPAGMRRLYGALARRGKATPIDRLLGETGHAFLFPNFARHPVESSAPSVVFVYDLSFFVVPETVHEGNRRYLTRAVPEAVRGATHVVTISEASRAEIIALLDVPPDRVSVIYPGVDLARFRPPPPRDVERTRAKLGLAAPYFVFCGTLEPRKNLERLIDAFVLFKRRTGAPHRLVLAGGRGWCDENLRRRIEATRDQGVTTIGYVNDEDLPALYRGSHGLVFPSLYEGFGIPPLEAMASGAPVLSSRASSLPEVCGDAALLVEPTDVDALAGAMADLAADEDLRESLRSRGHARVPRFSWGDSARRLLDLLIRLRARP